MRSPTLIHTWSRLVAACQAKQDQQRPGILIDSRVRVAAVLAADRDLQCLRALLSDIQQQVSLPPDLAERVADQLTVPDADAHVIERHANRVFQWLQRKPHPVIRRWQIQQQCSVPKTHINAVLDYLVQKQVLIERPRKHGSSREFEVQI